VTIRPAGLVLVVAIAGCTLLAPRPDRNRYFVLASSAPAGRGDPVPATASPPTLAIAAIGTPAYLDRSEIATRVGETRVVYSGLDRWAEPLSAGFTRVLAENLALRLAPRRLVVYPELTAAPDAALRVELVRFEANDAGRVELWARWSLRSGGGIPGEGAESRLVEAVDGDDAEQIVAALGRVAARFSDEVASAVRRLDATR